MCSLFTCNWGNTCGLCASDKRFLWTQRLTMLMHRVEHFILVAWQLFTLREGWTWLLFHQSLKVWFSTNHMETFVTKISPKELNRTSPPNIIESYRYSANTQQPCAAPRSFWLPWVTKDISYFVQLNIQMFSWYLLTKLASCTIGMTTPFRLNWSYFLFYKASGPFFSKMQGMFRSLKTFVAFLQQKLCFKYNLKIHVFLIFKERNCLFGFFKYNWCGLA